MPAVIRSLHNIEGTIVYPETIISAVHMLDGKRTVQQAFEEIADESCTISFLQDGSIQKVMTSSGMVIKTEFGDGVITETCRYGDETLYYTQTTTFNDDGTITIDKVYADNSEEEEEEGDD